MIIDTSIKTTTLKLTQAAGAVLLICHVIVFRLVGLLPTRDSLQPTAEADAIALEWLSFVAWPTFLLAGIVLWLLPQLKGRSGAYWGRTVIILSLLLVGIFAETAARMTVLASFAEGILMVIGAALQTAAAVAYLLAIRQDTTHSLHPSIHDMLLQIGAVWLVGLLSLHTAQTAAFAAGSDSILLVQMHVGLYKGLALGFVGNTSLWLLISTMPHLLDTREPPVRSSGVIVTYNLLLIAWIFGEIWSLHYPYTWVRLPLTLVGIAFGVSVVRLLSHLRVFDYLRAPVRDKRRLVVRTSVAAFVASILASAAIIAALGVWLGSTQQVVWPYMGYALRELTQLGMGSYILAAILIALTEPSPVDGKRYLLLWGLIIVVGIGLVATVLVSALGTVAPAAFYPWAQLATRVSAVGHLLVALWLMASMTRR
jgi:hypothetical protein